MKLGQVSRVRGGGNKSLKGPSSVTLRTESAVQFETWQHLRAQAQNHRFRPLTHIGRARLLSRMSVVSGFWARSLAKAASLTVLRWHGLQPVLNTRVGCVVAASLPALQRSSEHDRRENSTIRWGSSIMLSPSYHGIIRLPYLRSDAGAAAKHHRNRARTRENGTAHSDTRMRRRRCRQRRYSHSCDAGCGNHDRDDVMSAATPPTAALDPDLRMPPPLT